MEGFGVIGERENPRFVREEISSGGGAGWRVRERAADKREREMGSSQEEAVGGGPRVKPIGEE